MFGKRALLPLILIVASIILFGLNLLSGLEGGSGKSLGMVSNLLVIVAMVLVMLGMRKQRNND